GPHSHDVKALHGLQQPTSKWKASSVSRIREGLRESGSMSVQSETLCEAMPRRPFANPQGVLRSLAGLKSDSPVGPLPVILSNPEAEHGLHDLRAIALRFLDTEFLAAIRPTHSEPAFMLDAGVDAIGYAALVQSRYRDYAGIQKNLGALHDYLLSTHDPEIIN